MDKPLEMNYETYPAWFRSNMPPALVGLNGLDPRVYTVSIQSVMDITSLGTPQ